MTGAVDVAARPAQVAARVLAAEPAGVYRAFTLDAPAIAAGARPGQFVAVAVGGPAGALLLRRAFALHTADPATGRITIVVAAHGAGTRWLVDVPVGTVLDVVGPLGRPYPLPPPGSVAVLVGGGYGGAPLPALAAAIRADGGAAHLVLGAASTDRLFGVDDGRLAADSLDVLTVDGSAGRAGLVTDGLAAQITRTGAGSVYACGPMGMLAAVGRVAAAAGVPCHVAVEEAMACGIGVCMTCVLPVIGADGRTRLVRSCTEGPVFEASAVRWADVGSLPPDTVGADAMRAH